MVKFAVLEVSASESLSYRQGLLSGTAYDKIQALCADLAHPH